MKFWSKIHIHPLTIGIILIGLLTGYFKYMCYISMIIMIHELGHLFFMMMFKKEISSVMILPFGGLIKLDSKISENIMEELLIDIGGIFFQVIFGFTLLFLNKMSWIEEDIFNFFNLYNIFIITFNLLPICPLDGHKILKNLFELFFPLKTSIIISSFISVFILSAIIINDINIIKDNLFIFIFILYMSMMEFKMISYIMNRFYLERVNYDFDYPKKNVYRKEHMFKNRINYIKGVHEKKYLSSFFTRKTY